MSGSEVPWGWREREPVPYAALSSPESICKKKMRGRFAPFLYFIHFGPDIIFCG